jgi:hypothetical protein
MTATVTTHRTGRRIAGHRIIGRRVTRHPVTTEDQGFGYSREPDTTATDRPEPVPAGVALHFFTGRTPRRAAA